MEKMLSVTEYATLKEKDPGNIRRLLLAGRLEGMKVGNQWVIPFDAEYPEDRREKTGEYRNWRKKIELNRNKRIMGILKLLSSQLSDVYGPLLHEVKVYGSYARGTQTEESDVDIAVILNGKPSREMTDKMINCVAARELEAGKVLSVIDIEKGAIDKWGKVTPFYQNIEKEGISVWKEV